MNALFQRLTRNHLVYTVSWEDWELDQIALQLHPDDRVVMITGGGCNVLNFYLCGVQQISAVDLNPCQNALLELKLAAAISLKFKDFFALFGEGLHPDFGELYRGKLRPVISNVARQFWDGKQTYFSPGLWRRRFHQRSTAGLAYKILLECRRLWPRLSSKLDELFFCETLEVQAEQYRALDLRRRFNSPLFRCIFRMQVLMDLMAIPREQFRQVEQRYPGGMPGFALDCMDNIFTCTFLRMNYFWHVAWFGRFTPDCCPPYLQEENFSRLTGILDSVHTHTETLAAFLRKTDCKFDKFVLLDHMDWLSGTDGTELACEWDGIIRTASEHARIIFRTAGPDADYLQKLPIEFHGQQTTLQNCIHFDRSLTDELHRKDRVSIYGNFYACTLNKAD